MPPCREEHPMTRNKRRLLPIAAAVLALAACSKPAPNAPQSIAAAAPQFAAIARGRVDVEGGLVRVLAPRDGVIAELPVKAGDAVKQGDVIAAIDAHQAELAAGVARA